MDMVSAALARLSSQRAMISTYLPAGMELPQLSRTNQPKPGMCLTAISQFRTLGIFPANVSGKAEIEAALKKIKKDNSWLQQELAFYYAVYISYQLEQREISCYTFDDQILFALAILRAHPELVAQWQRKYEHIIIDEFQDFTPAETSLIGLLSHKHQNVLAVGDYTQRINMDFDNEVRLAETFGLIGKNTRVSPHKLTTNFRSVEEILNLAQAIPDLPRIYQHKQTSARGTRGLKPALIRVRGKGALISEGGGSINEATLQAMVDATLHYIDQLPPEDAGSVVLLAAKRNLAFPVQAYLKSKQRPFALLEYQYHYQSDSAKRYLTYLRLIQDRSQTDAVKFFLLHCLGSYFTTRQIDKLQKSADQRGQTLLETALDPDIIEEAEQLSELQEHIEIIQQYTSDSLCEDVWRAIQVLLHPPHIRLEREEQPASSRDEDEDIEEMLRRLGQKTVQEALKDVESSITFVEANKLSKKLVVATVDNAKSQDFDTVFLLGAELLKAERRWYVSITRARQRFFALVEASFSMNDHKILSAISKEYYDMLSFPGRLLHFGSQHFYIRTNLRMEEYYNKV